MTTRRVIPVLLFLSMFAVLPLFAQTDPGVRGGGAASGSPLASVAANNPVTILNFFNDAKARFQEIDSVAGTIAGENGVGLRGLPRPAGSGWNGSGDESPGR